MTLPYDTARCLGHDNPICRGCSRLEPGCPIRQSYANFPEPDGECRYRIDSNEHSWVWPPLSRDTGRHIGSVTTDLRGVGNVDR